MLTKLNNAYIHQGFPKIVTKYIYIIANKWEYNKYIKSDLVSDTRTRLIKVIQAL